jgi:hypothetical protein
LANGSPSSSLGVETHELVDRDDDLAADLDSPRAVARARAQRMLGSVRMFA